MFNPSPSPVPVSSLELIPSPTAAPPSAPPSSPTGSGSWAAAGCSQDGGARALTGYSFASDSMTPTLCQNTCASKGFTMAGVEYGSECYCESHRPIYTVEDCHLKWRALLLQAEIPSQITSAHLSPTRSALCLAQATPASRAVARGP